MTTKTNRRLVRLALLGALVVVLVIAYRALNLNSTAGDLKATPDRPQPTATEAAQGYPGLEAALKPGETQIAQGYPVLPPISRPSPSTPLPSPTLIPTPSVPPLPTWPPTPVVTRVPVSQPPNPPMPTGSGSDDYTVIIREKPDSQTLQVLTSHNDTLHLTSIPAAQVDLSEANVRPLIKTGTEGRLSPDGQRFAYFGADQSVWMTEPATGRRYQVASFTPEEDVLARALTWDSNSQRVAFYRASTVEQRSDIWLVEAKENPPIHSLVSIRTYASQLNWAPIGEQILYSSEDGEKHTPKHSTDLWVVNADTGEKRQLTHDMTVAATAWSLDAQWIVFEATHHLEYLEKDGHLYDLWLIASDGSQLRRLTDDEVSEPYVFWPTPNKIVFQRRGAGLWELNLVNNRLKQIYPLEVEDWYLMKK